MLRERRAGGRVLFATGRHPGGLLEVTRPRRRRCGCRIGQNRADHRRGLRTVTPDSAIMMRRQVPQRCNAPITAPAAFSTGRHGAAAADRTVARPRLGLSAQGSEHRRGEPRTLATRHSSSVTKGTLSVVDRWTTIQQRVRRDDSVPAEHWQAGGFRRLVPEADQFQAAGLLRTPDAGRPVRNRRFPDRPVPDGWSDGGFRTIRAAATFTSSARGTAHCGCRNDSHEIGSEGMQRLANCASARLRFSWSAQPVTSTGTAGGTSRRDRAGGRPAAPPWAGW